MTVVFYISGHGFGHASRSIEIINALGAMAPEARIHVRTSTAPWLFDATLRVRATLEPVACDTGVIQADSLRLDERETIREAVRFQAGFDALANRETAFLRQVGASAVVGDIPPLAFAAAARGGVPSVAISNFAWDWIYEGYPEALEDAPWLPAAIRDAYAQASLLLRLPMWGGLAWWPCPAADLPFVARHARSDAEDVRRYLGVADGRRIALASFGGLGIRGLNLEPLAGLRDWVVVTSAHALETSSAIPSGVVLLDDRAIYRAGFRYEDLVRTSDVVVTKPGYGIIAECLANDTALLYTARGRFAEYDVLVAHMPRFLRCAFIGPDDLHEGRWRDHLDRLVDQPAPPEQPATDGADVAARAILRLAGGEPPARIAATLGR